MVTNKTVRVRLRYGVINQIFFHLKLVYFIFGPEFYSIIGTNHDFVFALFVARRCRETQLQFIKPKTLLTAERALGFSWPVNSQTPIKFDALLILL